jgi:hypothetical protein
VDSGATAGVGAPSILIRTAADRNPLRGIGVDRVGASQDRRFARRAAQGDVVGAWPRDRELLR